MSEVNWNALMSAPNAGAAFANAWQQGRQTALERQRQEQAMREHQEDRTASRTAAELSQYREAIGLGARVIQQVQPKDQAGWDQVLNALRTYRIDPDALGVPRAFDPNYAQNVVRLAGPEGQELMAVAPGTAVIDKRTGRPVYQNPRGPRYIPVQPGSKLVLDPSSVGGATPPMVGGDDDEWETIGGPTPPASGGFSY